MEIGGVVALFAPLFLIAAFANVAERNRQQSQPWQGWAIVTYLFIAVLYLLALVIGPLLAATALLPADPEVPVPFVVDSPVLLMLGTVIPSLLGLLLLLPAVRRLIARVIPIDAENPVHAAALSLSMLVFINLFVTLGIGLANLGETLATANEAQGDAGANTTLALWFQQILTLLLAIVGVGWLLRRDGDGVFARLGITGITLRQGAIGLGLGLLMVPVVAGLSWLGSLLGLGFDPDVENLTEQLLGDLFTTPFGILTLGLAAALGEEPIFRGALQPRFGLWLTAGLFAVVHSNYGLSFSTLVVFLLGLVLGVVRIRYNTSTSMIVHAVYNISLGLITYFGLQFLDF